MPPKATKRVTATTKPSRDSPPPPFTPAPSSLAPLLALLDKRHIYITHFDAFPADYKRRIFLIPVVLNAFFLALIGLRIYYAVPKYLSILAATLGYASGDAVDTGKATWRHLVWVTVKRGLMFLGDWLLIQIVGSWPYTFFAEQPENPCTWRWKVGFRAKELVVRISRGWGAQDLFHGQKKGWESAFWKTKVLPAISREWMGKKTGYLMMGKEWDLDFPAMVEGQRALDAEKVDSEAVNGVMMGWHGTSESEGEWVVWRFIEQEVEQRPSKRDEYGMTQEEGENQMVMLRNKLASMGKEGLFFRMIEVAQYEGSVPGRSPEERERITVQEIQKLFSGNDIDFPKLVDELGLDFPGLNRSAG